MSSLCITEVLHDTISPYQNVFVGERQISHKSLIANESMEYLQTAKQEGLVLKLDFEKAYDSTNWCFLDSVMDCMGF